MVLRRTISCSGTFFINLIKQKFYHAIENAKSTIKRVKPLIYFYRPEKIMISHCYIPNMIFERKRFDVVNVGKTISFDSILNVLKD